MTYSHFAQFSLYVHKGGLKPQSFLFNSQKSPNFEKNFVCEVLNITVSAQSNQNEYPKQSGRFIPVRLGNSVGGGGGGW